MCFIVMFVFPISFLVAYILFELVYEITMDIEP